MQNSTSTSAFGVSKRENHNSLPFYNRFAQPVLDNSNEINKPSVFDVLYCGDSKNMHQIKDKSVGLVVTSPPYFVGKEYEIELERDEIPTSYLQYLEMLQNVFLECFRVLEPGGRIAVNVANLGRKPYRSLSSDVIKILQDSVGFLLRGEIIWIKAEGASGSCAWGSYASSANPTLRDVSERIIIASKGRFDRALSRSERENQDLPFETTISPEEFRQLTLDIWKFPPASAKKIGHPAPFPVELPRRIIELLSYKNDLILDPFLGSGQVAIAALQTGRHYIGYDIEQNYIELAYRRLNEESTKLDIIH